MERIEPKPLSTCDICREIPNHSGANVLNDETLVSPAYRLLGMEKYSRPPGSYTQDTVRCPICGTWYEYTCETGCMEYDLALRRLPAHEGYKDAPPEVLARVYAALTIDLESSVPDLRENAAGSLMVQYAGTGQLDPARKILLAGDSKTKIGALYAFCRYHLDIGPFIGEIIANFNDPDGHVRDAASTHFHSSSEAVEPVLRFQEKFLEELPKKPLSSPGLDILKKMAKARIDIQPVIPRLVEFANGPLRFEWMREDAVKLLKTFSGRSSTRKKRIQELIERLPSRHIALDVLLQGLV